MYYLKIVVLIIGLSAGMIYKTTHAEEEHMTITNNSMLLKENNTVIELKKDITVNTAFNLDQTLANLNATNQASQVVKVRKVTPVDNDSLERKGKVNITAAVSASTSTTTTTAAPGVLTKVLAEGGVVNITIPLDNSNGTIKDTKKNNETKENNKPEDILKESMNTNNITGISKNEKLNQQDKNNFTTTMTAKLSSSTTNAPLPSITVSNAKTTAAPTIKTTPSTTSTTTTTTTTTSTTTTTTATTTTPKPKKPTITYSVEDFPDLDKNNPDLKKLPASSSSSSSSSSGKLPLPPDDVPYAQPSQEFNNNSFHHGRDFILPIVSMIFIIPLVIGILITSYRRFRDCWSTRHYRRMDFLVDGMYND